MRRRLVIVVGIAAGCGSPKPAVTVAAPVVVVSQVERVPTPDALAPAQPTLRLPGNFAPTAYDARLALDPAVTAFEGSIKIAGRITERSSVIWLHGRKLAVTKALAQRPGVEAPLEVTPRGEDLLEVRAREPLDPGEWTLALDYRGELDNVSTAGAFRQTVADRSYIFTQFEALFARRVFPCIDEPDRKVPWKLTLDVPARDVAVANTSVVSETPLDGGKKRVEFAVTKPFPSYLVAFAVGPFEIVDAGKTRNGVPLRILTLAKRAADAAWAAKTTPKIVAALEDWFGQPYPYEKLDQISIPITVGFGAMENTGLITYTEPLILMDPVKASRANQHFWVRVATHEIAHQWFGDLVTMRWWDDIWLNEGFAKWMETKIAPVVEPSFRDGESDLDVRVTALDADALVSARQIRQRIDTTDDIFTAFDRITYDKGATVLNMFESYVGREAFQRGVRAYLAAHEHGNATSADFAAAIAKASGNPAIEAAFATFLEQPGAPEITATLSCAAGAPPAVALAQRRYVPPGAPRTEAAKPWHVPVCVAYDRGGARAEACTLLTEERATLALPAKACPRWVMPNVNARGYYRNAYTVAQLTALRDEAWPKLTWTERRGVYVDTVAGVRTGALPLQLALSFVPKLLAGNDRFTIGPAVELAEKLHLFVPDALRDRYEYWMRTTYGPGAAAAGLVPKDSDTLDVEETRNALIGAVAWYGRDPAVVAEAVRLAERWRELPQGIRMPVLKIAVDAKPALFERALQEVRTEQSRTYRNELYEALGAVRDPARQRQVLALVVDPKLDIRETANLFYFASTPAAIAVAQQYFRDHEAEILKRLPAAETTKSRAGYAQLFILGCDPAQRDAIVAYNQKTFGSYAGAPRILQQATETLDQCIAYRKQLAPELEAWLGGLKLPKKK